MTRVLVVGCVVLAIAFIAHPIVAIKPGADDRQDRSMARGAAAMHRHPWMLFRVPIAFAVWQIVDWVPDLRNRPLAAVFNVAVGIVWVAMIVKIWRWPSTGGSA